MFRLRAVALSLLALSPLFALEPGKPSKTSIWVLAARAIGSRDPDPTVRNPDWVADRMLGPAEKAILADNIVIKGLDKDYRVAMKDGETRARVLMMDIRTKYIDQWLMDAVKGGAQQVVILGAGFDSRAWRFRQELKSVKVFEVDFGPTQEYKRRRFTEVLGPAPGNLAFAPIDFTKETTSQVLKKAGYKADKKTFFIWEGVSMYLTQDEIKRFFSDVSSHAAKDSEIVFDHFNPFWENATGPNAALVNQLKGWGEPWVSSIPVGTEEKLMSDTGWKLTGHTSLTVTGDDAKKVITRLDGTAVGDVEFPAPGSNAPQRNVHWLARALVAAK